MSWENAIQRNLLTGSAILEKLKKLIAITKMNAQEQALYKLEACSELCENNQMHNNMNARPTK